MYHIKLSVQVTSGTAFGSPYSFHVSCLENLKGYEVPSKSSQATSVVRESLGSHVPR